MANKVEIDVIANDLASAGLELLKNKLMSVGNTTAMVGAATVAMGAMVAGAMKKSVDAAQAYDQQVYELMLRTGGTADETSRLIQVLDDTGIEYGVLENAMKFAVKNGIEPNVESLANLSDQYKALNSDVDKGKFLMDKFGRSGMDMARAMDMGGAALLKMNEEMSGGLILTEKNIQASEQYRKNLDELNDSWSAIVTTIGNKLIPVLNEYYDIYEQRAQRANDTQQAWNELQAEGVTVYNDALVAERIQKIELDRLTESQKASMAAWDGNISSISDYIDASNGAIDVQKLMTEMNKNFISDVKSMQSAEESYNSAITKLSNDRILLEQKLADEIAKGWRGSKETIAELTRQLDENGVAAKNAATEHDLANRQIMLGFLERKLMQDGVLDDSEMNYLLNMGVQWGIYSQTVVDETKAALAQVDLLAGGIARLPISKTFTYYIAVQGQVPDLGLGDSDSPVVMPGDPGWGFGDGEGPQANGGQFVIPNSYGTEGFNMGGMATASAGETVTVSRGAPSGGGGVSITYAPMFSTANKNELMNALRPMLDEWYRGRLTA